MQVVHADTRGDVPARVRLLRRGGAVAVALAFVAACAGVEDPPRRHEVEIRDFAYGSPAAPVRAGDTIVWINRDLVPHTATAADRTWDTGSVGAGENRSVVVASKGTHDVLCVFHPGMKGALEVR